MPIEKQVCSLDLAKRLKELGVKQESHFQWYKYRVDDRISYKVDERLRTPDEAAAFTVAELGEMLPKEIKLLTRGGNICQLETSWNFRTAKPNIAYYDTQMADGETAFNAEADTEADARAKMLIYLIENGLITPNAEARPQSIPVKDN